MRVNGVSSPMLHVVFGESAGGTLRLALRQAGREDEVISFNDNLSFGPISPPVPAARAAWARSELYFPAKATAALDEQLTRFWPTVRSAQKHVVWFSRRSAREFCGFLELVLQMGRRSYQVVDLTGVEIPCQTYGGAAASRPTLNLAELSPDEVRENALWDRAVPLSAEERQRYRRAWQSLRYANAPFRVVEGDSVISASIGIYDDMLLSCMTADWRRAALIIGEAMARNSCDPRCQAGDLVLFGRLRKLVGAGKLEARGDLAAPRHCEMRLSHP